MQNLSLSIIQSSIYWEDINANLSMFEEKIWQIDQTTDLILLPEMFTTGFSMNAKSLAEHPNGHTFKWMKQMAAQTGAVIAGSYIVRDGACFFNRLLWVSPDGSCDFYNKRHLFTLTGEHEIYQKGKERLVKELKGWKIRPLVCYDLRFPVWSRNKVQNGVFDFDLLICVANWPSSRNAAWETLLKARAVENSCYCAGINIVGTDKRGFTYTGNSAIYNPIVETILAPATSESINTVVLSKEFLELYRQKFPFLEDGDRFEIDSEL